MLYSARLMKAGKLPQALLASLLSRLPPDPRLLLGPGVGRDAAAIDLGDGRVLVAKTDPVTFATDRIGRYAVNVNANDIACLGARPSWFMATVLLPEGATPELAEAIFEQVRSACDELGIVPVGGHTEITIGLDRPIIAGAMLGETTADALVRPDGARAGDHVLLTKGLAIEGTALLARDAPGALRASSVPDTVIDAAARLLDRPGISVVRDAHTACATGHVHALHDPTEGGLATALEELALAAHLSMTVRTEEIAVLPETDAVCTALELDPLGLLASGALLIAVSDAGCDAVLTAIRAEGIEVACIGTLASLERAGIIEDARTHTPLPRFERDELARFLETLSGEEGERQ
ncbi:MAG: AIR synthase related protein [Dehalococcoidia bacterium]